MPLSDRVRTALAVSFDSHHTQERKGAFEQLVGVVVLVALCLVSARAHAQPQAVLSPRVDHHQHLLSARGASLLYGPNQRVSVPEGVEQLLHAHEAAWNEPDRLRPLYTAEAVAFDDFELTFHRGADAVARYNGMRFARPYRVTPLAFHAEGERAQLAVYFSRGEGDATIHVGSALLELVRDERGAYRIAVWYPHFPGPKRQAPLDAAKLIELLDAAGIPQAVLLSIAYWFDAPNVAGASLETLNAENDWTATEAARFGERLVPFCSLNPVSDRALDALAHCVQSKKFRGLKLHFASSRVNLLDADHVRRVREVFRAAAKARYAIVVHVRGEGDYGAAQARVFIDQLLPAAPGVVVQIAHLWGGGAFAPEALAVFATAVSAKLPGTQRLYFDVSDAALVAGAPGQPELVASRIRQIGLDRMLYGSDAAYDNHPGPEASWQAFRTNIPLSTTELQRIAHNVAPYLRPGAKTGPTPGP